MAEDMRLDRIARLILIGKKVPEALLAFPRMAEIDIHDEASAEDDAIARSWEYEAAPNENPITVKITEPERGAFVSMNEETTDGR